MVLDGSLPRRQTSGGNPVDCCPVAAIRRDLTAEVDDAHERARARLEAVDAAVVARHLRLDHGAPAPPETAAPRED
jgi:hypothetical protein